VVHYTIANDVNLGDDSDRRLLRACDRLPTGHCVVARTQNSFGDRSFAVAGLSV